MHSSNESKQYTQSGSEQLVESFFTELSSQLRTRPEFNQIGQFLEDYGDVFSGMKWLPVIGPWIDRAGSVSDVLGKLLHHRKEGVKNRRAQLEKALTDFNKKIVVVLDDIDRLSTPEIRDVFKLVRLTVAAR